MHGIFASIYIILLFCIISIGKKKFVRNFFIDLRTEKNKSRCPDGQRDFIIGILSLLFACFPLNELDKLDDRDDAEAERGCNEVFFDADRCESESIGKEGDLTYRGGCCERNDCGNPEHDVLGWEREDRAAL